MTQVPPTDWLISVDDHVIEPPSVWLERLPKKYRDRAPRMAKGDLGTVRQYEDTMDIGSSSTMAQISSDSAAPQPHVGASSGTMLSWLFSSYLQDLPNLRLSFSFLHRISKRRECAERFATTSIWWERANGWLGCSCR
jgi:hypothetical protein